MENQQLRIEQEMDHEIIALQRYITLLALFIGILFVFLSIVLLKALRARRLNNKRLESAIKERTAELELKNEELMISNLELERFAYVASHDLKEPLRNITSFANLIDRKLKKTDNDELKEYAGFIIDGTKQIYSLVDSILRFSEVKREPDTTLSQVDINQLILRIKNHLMVQLEEKNALLSFKNLPMIEGDEDQLFLLFKNLIENGIKYNENPYPTIEISHKTSNKDYIFYIKDNGIGIKPEYSKVIFEMFKRLHNRADYTGSGMGLSICKKIVDSLNGKIWVESNQSNGSTFCIRLPKPSHQNSTVKQPQKEISYI